MHDALIYIPMGFAIPCILWCLYFWYRRQYEQRNEAYFVMFGEPECCNPFQKSAITTRKCGKYCRAKLLNNLEQKIVWANASICVAMFNFNMGQLRDYIIRAKNRRGVQIRIILDKSLCTSQDNRQAKRLVDAGIHLRVAGDESGSDNAKLMHNKFCLVDGTRSDSVLITGSLNWTFSGFAKHAENVVFIHDQRIQKQYKEAFDHLWNKHATEFIPQ